MLDVNLHEEDLRRNTSEC